jgi:hypothetical protein
MRFGSLPSARGWGIGEMPRVAPTPQPPWPRQFKRCGRGPSEDWLVRLAERGLQQASGITLTKFCHCNNSPSDDFAHYFRLAGLLKLFKGSVKNFAHLRNCLGSEHSK